jgi:phosphoribosylformylglycinamidine cyclo-ligase
MQQIGNVSETEMHRTFNMGVGMVIICAEADAASVRTHIEARGEQIFEIGRVVAGTGERTVEFV